jgi:hypothetical protein
VKGLPSSADLRKKLHAVNSLDEVEGIFADYFREHDGAAEPSTVDADELDAVAV